MAENQGRPKFAGTLKRVRPALSRKPIPLPGRDVPWLPFIQALRSKWSDEAISNIAGSLTFFGVLAIFPFLLFLVALGSLVIDPGTAEELIGQLGEVAPDEVTAILGGRIEALGRNTRPGLLTLGAALALWAASRGVVALMVALNRVYGVKERRSYIRVRGTAVIVTLLAAVFSLLAALLMVALPPIVQSLDPRIEPAIALIRLPIAGVVMMLVWAMLYYFLPDVEQRFRFITPGSVMGVVVWLAASQGFSWYVQNFADYEASYGTLGGVIVLLLWMWISSQMVLLGALVNAVLEHLSPEGKLPGEKSLEESEALKGDFSERMESLMATTETTGTPACPPPQKPGPPPATFGPSVPAKLAHRRALAIEASNHKKQRRKPTIPLLPIGLAFIAGMLSRRD